MKRQWLMIKCRKNGVSGWLDEAWNFTTDPERAALCSGKDAAQTAIRMAKAGSVAGLGSFKIEKSDGNFRMPSKDMPSRMRAKEHRG